MTDRALCQELGRRIIAIRKARGLTQTQLGALIGVSGPVIHAIETVGRSSLTDARLTALATALDVAAWQIAATDWREQCGVSMEVR